MTRTTPFLFAALISGMANAQQLRIEPGTGDPLVLHFDPLFIARNGVKAISGEGQVKRDGEPMRPRNEHVSYRFSSDGRLNYDHNSFGRPGSGLDTASITYTYDGLGRLVEQLRNDLNGYYALRYELDQEGRPVRETYVRIDNIGQDRYHFVPGATTVVSDERFTYLTLNDSSWRKTFLNDRGLPYREQTFTKDVYGYLRSIQDRYVITERRGTITFRYDEKGRLVERIERPDLRETRTVRHTWSYDQAGNVLSCDLWHSDR
ncbi:MAG TPA: hypothetical protein VHL57_08650, partial [Flavobacteriales bacterium]|nr:hypothetical protein [Flavobacteriales bacterium]